MESLPLAAIVESLTGLHQTQHQALLELQNDQEQWFQAFQVQAGSIPGTVQSHHLLQPLSQRPMWPWPRWVHRMTKSPCWTVQVGGSLIAAVHCGSTAPGPADSCCASAAIPTPEVGDTAAGWPNLWTSPPACIPHADIWQNRTPRNAWMPARGGYWPRSTTPRESQISWCWSNLSPIFQKRQHHLVPPSGIAWRGGSVG